MNSRDYREVSNSDDIIDSRDVIAMVADLESQIEDLNSEMEAKDLEIELIDSESEEGREKIADLSLEIDDLQGQRSDLQERLNPVKALADECEGYASDWQYGATLIRDDYFEDFAREEAESLGLIKDEIGWPYDCIDWQEAAEQLQQDYSSVDFDGVTYWVR